MQKLSLTVSTNLVRVQGITNNLERCRFKKLSSLENLSYQKTRRLTSTGIFSTHLFCSRCLRKDEGGFFQKKYSVFLKLCDFSKFEKFLFFSKNLTIKVEKTFSNNNIIWYAFHSKFAAFTDFLKKSGIFPKKGTQLFRKKNFRKYLRNLSISVVFYGKFAIIWSSKNFK